MKNEELKMIAESLIETTEKAGKKTIELHEMGLKIIKKPDDSPVTNGDLEVDKMLKEKIKKLTPNIPIISDYCPFRRKSCTFLDYYWFISIVYFNQYMTVKNLCVSIKEILGLIYDSDFALFYYVNGEFNRCFDDESELIITILQAEKIDAEHKKCHFVYRRKCSFPWSPFEKHVDDATKSRNAAHRLEVLLSW